MASIRRHGKGFQARVHLRGAAPVAKTFPTKALAKEWASATETKIYRGLIHGPGFDKTLADAIEYYMDRVAPVRLAHDTIKTHSTALALWSASSIGPKLLAHITASDIADVRDNLTRKGLAPATVNRYFTALSAVLSMCEEREWIQINPCRKLRKLVEKGQREVALDDEQSQRLLQHCLDHSHSLYRLVHAALATGARRGELEKLTWNDVDLEAKTLTFRDTKNGDTRHIPLPADVGHYLTMVRQASAEKPFEALNRALWDRIRVEADLPHVRFHDLRHTFATRLAKAGCPVQKLAAILGHRSLNMTMRYSHLNVDDLRELVR
jgi:integrase